MKHTGFWSPDGNVRGMTLITFCSIREKIDPLTWVLPPVINRNYCFLKLLNVDTSGKSRGF